MIVCFNTFISATEEVADYLLPMAMCTERVCVKSTYGTVCAGDKAIDPLGEAKQDCDMWKAFYQKMPAEDGWHEVAFWDTPYELADYVLSDPHGLTWQELYDTPEGVGNLQISGDPDYVPYENYDFPTPSGKVEFYSQWLEDHGYHPVPRHVEHAQSPISTPEIAAEYPLIGASGYRRVTQYNQFHGSNMDNYWITEIVEQEAKLTDPEIPYVIIHPKDGPKHGIEDKDIVWVESTQGKVKCRAYLRPIIQEGVAIWPNEHYARGGAYQALNPFLQDFSWNQYAPSFWENSTPAYKGWLCKVYKA
jgi:anaerobic selenocysteine-containing dehydrogenase